MWHLYECSNQGTKPMCHIFYTLLCAGRIISTKLNLKTMFNLFKQKEAKLYNGKKVKEGDKVFFITSDGERVEGKIERRQIDYGLSKPQGHLPRFQTPHTDTVLKKGTLFFWNPEFLIEDYFSADVVS